MKCTSLKFFSLSPLGSVAHHGAEHEVHVVEVSPRRIGDRFRLGRRQNPGISPGIRQNSLYHSRRPQPRSEKDGSTLTFARIVFLIGLLKEANCGPVYPVLLFVIRFSNYRTADIVNLVKRILLRDFVVVLLQF